MKRDLPSVYPMEQINVYFRDYDKNEMDVVTLGIF